MNLARSVSQVTRESPLIKRSLRRASNMRSAQKQREIQEQEEIPIAFRRMGRKALLKEASIHRASQNKIQTKGTDENVTLKVAAVALRVLSKAILSCRQGFKSATLV